jgi:hypothetical protein
MAPETAVQKLRRWRKDPLAFIRENFSAEPDDWQAEYILSVRDNQRTAAKACKGPGKSCGMSWAGWWFISCFPNAKGIAISITGDNLRDNLWAEFAFWQKKSPYLSEYFEWTSERISCKESPANWFISARQWSKQADQSQQSNTLAGLHGEYTIVLIDEAGDIPSSVTAAADASLSTGKVNRIMMAGNPTRSEGPLYEACTRDRHMWSIVEITGDPDDPKRAKRIDINWARQQIEKWGPDNPWVLVNVFGRFPPVGSDKLVGPDECSAAARRHLQLPEYNFAPRVLGVDVARFGDDESVFQVRQGRVAFTPRIYRNLDLASLADQVVGVARDEKVDAMFIDGTGVGGGVVDFVRRLGWQVTDVNFGEKAQDESKFENKRAEMWWRMADWIRKTQPVIPNDPALIQELTAPSYRFNQRGRLVLESKDDMKKRGLPSPNRADALGLTFAYDVRPKSAPLQPTPSLLSDDPHAEGGKAIVDYTPYR